MKFKKIIKWIIFIPFILFMLIWTGTLAKNRILTELHRDEIASLEFYESEPLPEFEWYRILSYSETEIEIYYVNKFGDSTFGGIVNYRYLPNINMWSHNYTGYDCLWSTSGSADNFIWPYWLHIVYLSY